MANEDRRKKSWREIDKSRDGGGGRREPPRTRPDPAEERQQKQYRAALEALFEKGGIGKLAEKLAPPPAQRSAPEEPAAPAEDAPASARAPEPAGKKKTTEDRLALRRKVVEAVGRQEITKAAEKYLDRFPLPDDHEFLEQILEHERESRVQEAMDRIAALLDQRIVPKRSRALCSKLRYLGDTAASEELREKASGLLKQLG